MKLLFFVTESLANFAIMLSLLGFFASIFFEDRQSFEFIELGTGAISWMALHPFRAAYSRFCYSTFFCIRRLKLPVCFPHHGWLGLLFLCLPRLWLVGWLVVVGWCEVGICMVGCGVCAPLIGLPRPWLVWFGASW